MSSVAHRTLPYLWTLSHKRKNFGIEFLNYLFVWFFLQILSETFLILRRIQRDVVTNVETSSCKVLAALLTVQCDLNFVDRLSKNPQISNIKKILIMGAELFHADRQMDGWMGGQTDQTKLIVAFCHFWMRLRKDVTKIEVGTRGAGLWRFCSLSDTDSGHKMLVRSSRPVSDHTTLRIKISCFTMKTTGYLSSVTPTFRHPEAVSMSNTQKYAEMRAVLCSVSAVVWTTKHEIANNGSRDSTVTIVNRPQVLKPNNPGSIPAKCNKPFSSPHRLIFNGYRG